MQLFLQCMKQEKQWRKAYPVSTLPPSMLPVCIASPCLPYSFNLCPMAWLLRMVMAVIMMVPAQVGTAHFKTSCFVFKLKKCFSDSIHTMKWTKSDTQKKSVSYWQCVVELNCIFVPVCPVGQGSQIPLLHDQDGGDNSE